MAKKRTVILLKSAPSGGGYVPLGSLAEVQRAMRQHNIAADGSGPRGLGERLGTGVLHGPGMVLEVPFSGEEKDPEIAQVLVSVTDEDFAWPVLMKLCKVNGWKMMDPESGRTFG